jgi:hypothetical protein
LRARREHLQRLPGRDLLRVLLRSAGPAAQHLAAHRCLHVEDLEVVGAVVGHDPVPGRDSEAALADLLQLRLEVPVERPGGRALVGVVEEPVEEPLRGDEPVLEEHGREHRLERVGEERGLLPPTGHLLAAPQPEELADSQLASDAGEPGLVHDRGPHLGQLALARPGEALHQPVGHEQVHDGVAQELEALVVLPGLVPVLVDPGLVRQGREGAGPVAEREPQALLERGDGVGRRARRAPLQATGFGLVRHR